MSLYLKDRFQKLARQSHRLRLDEVGQRLAIITQAEEKYYLETSGRDSGFAQERAFNFAQLGFERNAANPGHLVLPLRPLNNHEYRSAIVAKGFMTFITFVPALTTCVMFSLNAPSALAALKTGVSAQAFMSDIAPALIWGATMLIFGGLSGKYLKQTFNAAMNNTMAICIPKTWATLSQAQDITQENQVAILKDLYPAQIRYRPF